MTGSGVRRREFFKLTGVGFGAAAVGTSIYSLFGRRSFAQLPASVDPHTLHRHMTPFGADEVRVHARNLRYSNETKMERAAADAMEYFDVVPPPSLEQPSPIVLGRVKIKIGGTKIAFGDRENPIPVGEYYNWIGKKDGHWIAGFASIVGDVSVPAEVLFPVEATSPHHHLQTYTHDPVGSTAWRHYSLAAAGLPIPGAPPLPPGAHRPPRQWRCVEVWKWVTLPTGERGCTVIRWVRVPA